MHIFPAYEIHPADPMGGASKGTDAGGWSRGLYKAEIDTNVSLFLPCLPFFPGRLLSAPQTEFSSKSVALHPREDVNPRLETVLVAAAGDRECSCRVVGGGWRQRGGPPVCRVQDTPVRGPSGPKAGSAEVEKPCRTRMPHLVKPPSQIVWGTIQPSPFLLSRSLLYSP